MSETSTAAGKKNTTQHTSWHQKISRIFFHTWIKRITCLLALWIIIHVAYITIDGLRDYEGRADVAVILGNRVYADGSLSPWLQGRVDKALQLYKQGKVKKIFASGGISTKEDNYFPEGDAMKNYLVQHGVQPADIIADNKGQNTFLTASNFIAWNKSQHYSPVIVVSQFYHITRSKYIFRKLCFANVHNASSDSYSSKDIGATLREVPAFYKYLLVY